MVEYEERQYSESDFFELSESWEYILNFMAPFLGEGKRLYSGWEIVEALADMLITRNEAIECFSQFENKIIRKTGPDFGIAEYTLLQYFTRSKKYYGYWSNEGRWTTYSKTVHATHHGVLIDVIGVTSSFLFGDQKKTIEVVEFDEALKWCESHFESLKIGASRFRLDEVQVLKMCSYIRRERVLTVPARKVPSLHYGSEAFENLNQDSSVSLSPDQEDNPSQITDMENVREALLNIGDNATHQAIQRYLTNKHSHGIRRETLVQILDELRKTGDYKGHQRKRSVQQ